MSKAQEMLAALADDEPVDSGTVSEGRIVINPDRSITVPESIRRLGVQHDHNIETVSFDCPRYWDGRDLSTMSIYINYMCPDNSVGKYVATGLTVEEDRMYFDWTISSNVTRLKGTISFLVCAVEIGDDGVETLHWNSDLNRQCFINEGLECNETIIAKYPDVITYLLTRLNAIETGGSGGTILPGVNDQLDFTQNDPSQPNYIKNRTHWEEDNRVELILPGTSDEIEHFTAFGKEFYKVSDETPNKADFVGATIRNDSVGQEITLDQEAVDYMFTEVAGGLIGDGIIVAYDTTIILDDGTELIPPSAGVYFALVEGIESISITYGSVITHPLDEKYIPDTIARKEDIPEVNYPVTSVNGMTGDVVIEAGGSGVSSWNDLTDKPFYEEAGDILIEWDGNTEGRDPTYAGDYTYYKVSDLTPTVEEINQAITTSEYSVTTTEDNTLEVTGGILVADGVIVAHDTTVAINDSTTLTVPSTGVYFARIIPTPGVQMNINAMSYGDTSITWDGDIEGRDSGVLNDTVFYKVSDLTPTLEELTNATVSIRQTVPLALIGIEEMPGGLLLGDGDTGVVIYDTATIASSVGVNFPSTGLYLASPSIPLAGFSIEISYHSTVIHRLDPKFLPEGGVGWVEKSEPVIVEFDGNFDDKPYIDVSDSMRMHKISDAIPTIGEAGVKMTLVTPTGETTIVTIPVEDIDITSEGAMFMSFRYGVMCVIVYGSTVEGVDFSSLGPGTYLVNDDYVSGVTVAMDFSETITHQIDEKFIPDSIARVDDIPKPPDLTAYVKSVNGVTPTTIDGSVWVAPYQKVNQKLTDNYYIYNGGITTTVCDNPVSGTVYTVRVDLDTPEKLVVGDVISFNFNVRRRGYTYDTPYWAYPPGTYTIKRLPEANRYYIGHRSYLTGESSSYAEADGAQSGVCVEFHHDEGMVYAFTLYTNLGSTTYDGVNNNISIWRTEMEFSGILNEKFIPDTIARKYEVPSFPDWDQCDETKRDYVKNRTHWIKKEHYFASQSTRSNNVETESEFWYGPNVTIYENLSDDVPLLYENSYITGTITVADYSDYPTVRNQVTFTNDDITKGDGYWLHSKFIVIISSEAVLPGETEPVGVPPGIYGIAFLKTNGAFDNKYTAEEITFDIRTYYPLDDKLIPSTIARVKDIPQGGAQPDWNQNDSTQPDYVKNRTHWEEGSGATIEWDGNTEGRDSVLIGDPTFYKVSDLVPTKAELIGGKVTVNGSVMEVTEDFLIEGSNCLFSYAGFAVVYDNSFSVMDSSGTANSCGMYFIGRSQAEVSKLTYGSTTVHQIDEKFIPDTIARKSDIPSVMEPAEEDIPKVFFGGALPQTKDDTVMSFRYISKTMDISGYCKTKAQGDSSMGFPKKNQTVKLYKDAACAENLKLDFKGWGEQNEFCFKANWVDLTHARNIVSARLWGDVVKSRANYEAIPELLRTSPNLGAVDGFPIKVYAGGVYQGRYTLNIPKDAWMANMDNELNEHCILCSENYESGCFRAEAVIDESDWTDEVHDTVPDSIKTRWNEVISFVMTSTDDEFIANIGNYFDLTSLIDYYLFGTLICHMDGFGKNQVFITYDGQKWYASVYDLDSTFGTYFSTIHPVTFARGQFEDYEKNNGNLLYIRLESLFIPEIQARWDELRNGALSIDNIINRFERFTDIAPPYLVEEDYAETTGGGKFTAIPLQGQSNIQQIRGFIYGRYEYFMHYIEALGTNGGLLYYLPDETTFNGTSDYIDTGLALMSEARSFTIFADYTEAESVAKGSRMFSCVQDHGGSSYGGLAWTKYPYSASNGYFAQGYPGNADGQLWVGPHNFSGRTRIAIVFEEGVPSKLYGQSETYSFGAEDVWGVDETVRVKYPFIHSRNILLGCREYGSQYENKGNFWAGTIHAFEVWAYAMTNEEIIAKVEGA